MYRYTVLTRDGQIRETWADSIRDAVRQHGGPSKVAIANGHRNVNR